MNDVSRLLPYSTNTQYYVTSVPVDTQHAMYTSTWARRTVMALTAGVVNKALGTVDVIDVNTVNEMVMGNLTRRLPDPEGTKLPEVTAPTRAHTHTRTSTLGTLSLRSRRNRNPRGQSITNVNCRDHLHDAQGDTRRHHTPGPHSQGNTPPRLPQCSHHIYWGTCPLPPPDHCKLLLLQPR